MNKLTYAAVLATTISWTVSAQETTTLDVNAIMLHCPANQTETDSHQESHRA